MLRSFVVFALFLLAAPPVAWAASASPVSAVGPDAEGAFVLSFDVPRDAAGEASLALDASRDDGSSVARSTRDLGRVAFEAGVTRWSGSFLPADGAGAYAVRLVVDGVASDALTFDVASDGGARDLRFQVADEPSSLVLTNDSVNADGKLKSPGEDVVTRASLSDGNGVGDVDAVSFRVVGAAWSDAGIVPVTAAPGNTSAALELRYARSPIPAGSYRLTLEATKGGIVVANASRTFTIRDVATTLANASLGVIVPDAASSQTADIVLLDRNEPAPAPDVKIYKGSARVEPQGFRVTLGQARPLPDADGAARVAFPMLLEAPANASPGSYRVSAYENGSLVGSIPFDVAPLPTFASVVAEPSGGSLRIVANVTAHAILRASLEDGAGASTTTTLDVPAGPAIIVLDAPGRAASLRWSVLLAARVDGPQLDARNGSWERDLAPLALRMAGAAHASTRLPAAWSFDAPGWDLAGGTGNVTVLRWDGAPAPVTASYHDGVVRVEGPATLEAGRYLAHLDVVLPNGTLASASWSFDAAPWLRLRLGQPTMAQREARLPLANEGGVPVGRVVIEFDAPGNVTLEVGGRELAALPGSAPGRFVIPDAALAPGGLATLVVRLPEGPLRAGEHAASLRVLALAEARA